jgi:1-acyl-sn-glycerol-3-phosphate acyltransferase
MRLYFIGDATGTSDAWLKRQGIDLVGGLVPIDRYQSVGDRAALNRALDVLRARSNLVVYPEGERGEDEGRLLPLRRGIGFLARQANAPTVVLGLGGTRFLWRGKTLRLNLGTAIPPPGPGKAGEQAYTDDVRRAMLSAMPPAEPAPPNPEWQWLTTLL